MILPARVEKTPRGKIKECSEPGSMAYFKNEEYNLQISIEGPNVVITYMSENCDNTLNDKELKSILKQLATFEE